jgi:nucleoside-diphosphate-sugar epimerase
VISTVEQLDDLLATPSQADIQEMRRLTGDLLILGVGGKMGPTLAMRAQNAVRLGNARLRITGVSRFSSDSCREQLDASGIRTIAADLLDPAALADLPDAESVIYMAGRKFGTVGDEALTWAMNAFLPAAVAERYKDSNIVAFSSGNVYPFVSITSGGATETTAPQPAGEYAQSVLARERLLEYFSVRNGTPMTILRLNYAVELRYGVLLDIGTKVFERRPIDLTTPMVNVIWQGDANSVCLRAFRMCESPPAVLNVTGPEALSVRAIANAFGEHFGVEPAFTGEEGETALLNNAAQCHRLFGYPEVTPSEIIDWTARWIGMGGATLAKPTHFEIRDGNF